MASYFGHWILAEDGVQVPVILETAAQAYQRAGLSWLAGEVQYLADRRHSSDKGLAQSTKPTLDRSGKGDSAQVASLVDLVRPNPAWQRSLSAIQQLAVVHSATGEAVKNGVLAERILWEIDSRYSCIVVTPYSQKRNKQGWTGRRRIGLERLFETFNSPEFAFATDKDRAIVGALIAESRPTYRRYTEMVYEFDELRLARALIGHPCVFRQGDHEHPVEVVEQLPRLIASQQDGRIRLTLDPEPVKPNHEGLSAVRHFDDGPRRLRVVIFNDQQLRLHKLLGGGLELPASSAPQVLATIRSIASLVAVHSEISGDDTATECVTGDARPQVQLLPIPGGLRAEFYVRPFGDDGPFYRPGEGGVNVYASLGGKPVTARRNLDREQQCLAELVSNCTAFHPYQTADRNGGVDFPSAEQGLEALLQLEALVRTKSVVLHWPQGGTLKLAGSASTSQFQLRIRRDRDWFAASGTLQVDPTLSIDMLKLIELVDASPSRFVQLDDGRFLALTDQLRRKVKEWAAFSERRGAKLRFPAVRAATWEELADGTQLKADSDWQECVQRMHGATQVRPEVPTTLQAELRDYQRDAFQWLASLADWGVGGCLADDMGLGKTVEALALLLHRAVGGPALVVAPMSVGFNWVNETNRFAPTLNPRLFGTGDREAFFQQLGPRDVVITSYGLLHSEVERFHACRWSTVILDEAQAIKNVGTLRSQAAMGLQADFRLIMTGTPLENHLGELWNLFQFINPGLLGSLEAFQQRFSVPIESDHCLDTRRRLKKLIQPFILRRTKTQVLSELPSRTELTLQVQLSDAEAAFYEALRLKAVEKLTADDDDGLAGRPQHLRILAEIMRLRRACCHPKMVFADCSLPSAKLALFSQTIDELVDNHHKALVFSQFVDHLSILREELDRKGIRYQYLDGSTPAKDRRDRVEAFQSGQGDVFLISLKAGGPVHHQGHDRRKDHGPPCFEA